MRAAVIDEFGRQLDSAPAELEALNYAIIFVSDMKIAIGKVTRRCQGPN